MSIRQLNENLDIISALDDEPNDVGGMSAAELKGKFDESGNRIKRFVNQSLIPDIEGFVNQKVGGLALGDIPDGTITVSKLDEDLRRRMDMVLGRKMRLSHLLTTPGTSEFVVPEGMEKADIVILGGGASGEHFTSTVGGFGGGSGYLTFVEGMRMTPGEIIPVVIGADSVHVGTTSGYNTPGNLSAFGGYIAEGGKALTGPVGQKSFGSNGGSGGGGRADSEPTHGGSNGTNGETISLNNATNRPGGMGSGARARNPHDPNGNYCGGGASSGGDNGVSQNAVRGGEGFMGRGGDAGRDATGYGNGGGGGSYSNRPGKGTQGCVLIYTADDLTIERPLANFRTASGVELMPAIARAAGTDYTDSGTWGGFGIETISGSLSISCEVEDAGAGFVFGFAEKPSGYGPDGIDFGVMVDGSLGRMYAVDRDGIESAHCSLANGDIIKIAFEEGRFVWYRNGEMICEGLSTTLNGPLTPVIGFGGAEGKLKEINWCGRAV